MGEWYEQDPGNDPRQAPPAGAPAPPTWAPPSYAAAPGYAPHGAPPAWPAAPAPGYPPAPGYEYGYGYPYGYPPAPVLDKGARTSLVLSIVSFFFCGVLLGPAAIIEGVKARNRIRVSRGALKGDGLALAGIIIGSVATVVAFLSLVIIFGSSL